MVLVAVYREPLIWLSQLNAHLTGGIWGYIFVKRVLLVSVCVKSYKRLKMSEISEEKRHVMLFHYRKGYNASQISREICAAYGEDAVTDRTMRNSFERFRGGNKTKKPMKFCNWSRQIDMQSAKTSLTRSASTIKEFGIIWKRLDI